MTTEKKTINVEFGTMNKNHIWKIAAIEEDGEKAKIMDSLGLRRKNPKRW